MSAELVERFYAAFDRRDGVAMAAAYAPDGHFRDPVFGDLTGAEAGAMWRMLTRTARDLKVELAEHDDASAHWIATLHVLRHRAPGGQRRAGDVPLRRRADRRPRRRVQLLEVVAAGAGHEGPGARLDAVPALARSAGRPRRGWTSSSPRSALERDRAVVIAVARGLAGRGGVRCGVAEVTIERRRELGPWRLAGEAAPKSRR